MSPAKPTFLPLPLNAALARMAFGALSLTALAGCTSEDEFSLTPARESASSVGSLTGKYFSGKKFYLGWGHAGNGDPDDMHNETKFDVLHTHEIFTRELGGAYAGAKLVGSGSNEAILQSFGQIKGQLGPTDMFVQYSSGHGFESGLQYGGDYNEIASRVLALPAREIITFTMACHSGGLIDTYNSMQSQWAQFAQSGRTFFAMASSTVDQTSSTGPGSDGSGGPYGSAGSAFGHALWKALSGEADGAFDGVRDGFVELGEIELFVKRRTEEIGGHTPVTTGAYNPGLIMNRVPTSFDGLSYGDRGTTNATDAQMRELIQTEDARS